MPTRLAFEVGLVTTSHRVSLTLLAPLANIDPLWSSIPDYFIQLGASGLPINNSTTAIPALSWFFVHGMASSESLDNPASDYSA